MLKLVSKNKLTQEQPEPDDHIDYGLRSVFSALLLARRYCEDWSEICVISQGPYTVDSFRLLGEYQVVELPARPEPMEYSSLIQEQIKKGLAVFILMQNNSLDHTMLSGQEGHNDIKKILPQLHPTVSFFITIHNEKGYVLIELEKSKS